MTSSNGLFTFWKNYYNCRIVVRGRKRMVIYLEEERKSVSYTHVCMHACIQNRACFEHFQYPLLYFFLF